MFKDKLQKQYTTIIAILFFWFLFGSSAQAQTQAHKLEIVPANPKAHEPVILRVELNEASGTQSMWMNANRIIVTIEPTIFPMLPPPPPLEVDLGQLPAGNYEVELVSKNSTYTTSLGVKPFIVTAIPKIAYRWEPLDAFTGMWWNPAESGWGMSIIVKNGKLLSTWFAYDDAGRAAWLTIQDVTWVADPQPRCYQGLILRTSGPPLGGILSLSKIDYSPVGRAKFCFSDDNQSMQFSYTVDEISNQKTLYRQLF